MFCMKNLMILNLHMPILNMMVGYMITTIMIMGFLKDHILITIVMVKVYY